MKVHFWNFEAFQFQQHINEVFFSRLFNWTKHQCARFGFTDGKSAAVPKSMLASDVFRHNDLAFL